MLPQLLPQARLAIISLCLAACNTSPGQLDRLDNLEPGVHAVPSQVLAAVHGVTVHHGGFGSAIAVDPTDTRQLYLLTDRGPNTDTRVPDQKFFPVPTFTPQIGHFRLDGDFLRLVRTIELKNAAGRKLTGIPNPPGAGGTGETAVAPDGVLIAPDPNGVDTEGLVVLPDGSFWVSDEYGPHLLHLDTNGRTLERLSPFGSGTRSLPAVFARRQPNAGMEGLTVLPDGRTLVGIMQSPLDNPKAAGRISRTLRILFFDTRTGASRQYLYLLEPNPSSGNTSLNGVSEIAAISDTSFLVLERDSSSPGDTLDPATTKRIYRISTAGATDVSDPSNRASGRLVRGKTLEALSLAELRANGITPVRKSLVLDLLSLPGGYPHDKPEGLALVGDRTLVIVNDDDFGVTDRPSGSFQSKILPQTGRVDRNAVFIVRLRAPLH